MMTNPTLRPLCYSSTSTACVEVEIWILWPGVNVYEVNDVRGQHGKGGNS